MKWIKTKYPGVRYREHATRKHGIQKDRYFTIYYKMAGKLYEEGLGWASAGWTAEKAAHERGKLKNAQRTGQGPTSLAEKRELERVRKEKETAEKTRQAKESITLDSFFTETYSPIAKTSKKGDTYSKEETHYRLWLSPHIGNMPLKDIAPFHLEKIKKAMLDAELTPRTIEYCLATFRQTWNAARRAGLVAEETPTRHIKLPKIDNRRLRFLSHEEAHTLLYGLALRREQLYNMALQS